MRKLKMMLMLIFLSAIALAQSPLNSSLGNFKKIEAKNQEFTIYTDNGVAKVDVYSANVFRIRIEQSAFLKTFSYAVVANPVKCNVNTSENADTYTISTDSVVLKIQKKPVRFSFYTPSGTLINADDASFGTSWMGEEVTTYKALQDGERFIGLGEHTGDLDRRGDYAVNWNTDDPGYTSGSKSLYASIPFYIGLHHNLCYGIFLDNSSQTVFNFGAANNRFASFMVNCGEMDYYFIYQPDVSKVIESYTWLTGRTPLPPVWSLGYQQCRYSYFPDKQVLSVASEFRSRSIPADMIYLDIHYMDHFKLFTWDNSRFPNPTEMINQLKNMSFHLAVIIDPGVKTEKNYPVYEDGLKSDIFIKYPDGTNYMGEVWPGKCNFPDFTMPKARDWWGNWVKTYADEGVTGYWNDMNEIAAWGKDVPRLLELNWEGKKTSYREGKNVYGMEMARSTYEGARKNMDGKRPFVLTRAGYAGLQRYTAIWTGDNQSTDDHMMLGVRLLNSMGLSGISFAGMDIGGFSGNPTVNLYTRWMQLGAFLPMFRQHTAIYTKHGEPWTMGEEAEDIVRRYIGFRYQLMPYIYSAFYESSLTGMPVQRSLVIDYASDKRIFSPDFQQEYLFGPSILVAPVTSNVGLVRVLLPKGTWYDLFTDKAYEGNQETCTETPMNKLPLYIKGGSIIPMQKLVESTADNAGDTLYIHLYNGEENNQFVYYEDDGVSYNYTTGGYFKRTISFDAQKHQLVFGQKSGNLSSKYPVINLVFHGFVNESLNNVSVNGESRKVMQQSFRLFASNFRFADYGPDDTKTLSTVNFKNDDGQITVSW